MTKSELLDRLQDMDDDAQVYIEFFDYGFKKLGNVYVDEHGDIILEP